MNAFARTLALTLTLATSSSLLSQSPSQTPAPGSLRPSAPGTSGTAQLVAESAPAPAVSSSIAAQPFSALPDAPTADAPIATPLRASFTTDAGYGQPGARTAPKYAKFIASSETAVPLSGGDKFVLSLHQLYSPLALAGSVVSAGYSHAVNGSPNYGTNGKAFAQRLGASVARGSSQELFSDGILAPALHVDPRYYVLGHDYNFVHRAFYAATRVISTKTDRGHTTINAPLLLGYAGAAGLSNVYYPQINRNFKDTAAEYGGSLGGAALGFVVSEFADDFLRAIHIKTK